MHRRKSYEWTPARRANWHHNMFLGHVKRITLAMPPIQTAETTTDEARVLASQIEHLAYKLYIALRTRRTPGQ